MKKHVSVILAIVTSLVLAGCGGGGRGESGNGGSIPPLSGSRSITFMWDAPTTKADGSLLDDLKGYRIYYGSAIGEYVDFTDIGLSSCVGSPAVCTLTVMLDSQYTYFAVTAYNSAGEESDFSNEIVK